MKKTILIIVLAVLCINFGNPAIGQIPKNQAVDVTAKGVQIGQKVPGNPILSKYKGKLIILDFWATWCSPCVAMIPKMEALQEQFKNEIQILSITYQPEKEVSPFLNKLHKGKPSILPQIMDDKQLHKLFPHVYLPHYVWIDETGTVKAITGLEEITAENIKKMLDASSGVPVLKQKKDVTMTFDEHKPLLINGNGGDGSGMQYHSILAGYIEGLSNGYKIDVKNSCITVTNLPVLNLFQIAYGADKHYFNNTKTLLKLKDTTKVTTDLSGEDCLNWMRSGNGYNYELRLPQTTTDSLFLKMQTELRFLFPQYVPVIEMVSKKCLALVITEKSRLVKSTGGKPGFDYQPGQITLQNTYLNVLTSIVERSYFRSKTLPVVNNTNYTETIDLDLRGNLADLKELNVALEKYGLRFSEMEVPVATLVLRDR